MRISKEGWPLFAGLVLFALMFGYFGFSQNNAFMIALFGIDLLLLLTGLYFFRDPVRVPPATENIIVSPADGKVIDIKTVEETDYLQQQVTRIDIFLSLFDVHMNYIPFKGKIDYIHYKRGKNLPAYRPEASRQNQHAFFGLLTRYGKMAFKQSAGMVARRIVWYVKLDQAVETGQKFGMIKFGSRLEVYLPGWAKIRTKPGDRLKGGESVIAEIDETS